MSNETDVKTDVEDTENMSTARLWTNMLGGGFFVVCLCMIFAGAAYEAAVWTFNTSVYVFSNYWFPIVCVWMFLVVVRLIIRGCSKCATKASLEVKDAHVKKETQDES